MEAVDAQAVEVRTALSPSRASDFLTCPLLYRLRTIDRLPEPPDPVAVRGTLVHAVLEHLFGEAAVERTLERAQALLPDTWETLREEHPELADLEVPDGWLASADDLLASYFALEDPRQIEPEALELRVDHVLESGLALGGIVDRIDVAPDGRIRVVDYKGLALETPLPTPTGWTTMRDVRVGDQLIGSNGEPIRVTGKSQVHHRPCYRMTFRDGSSVVCDNVHLWPIVISHRQTQTPLTPDMDSLAELHGLLREDGLNQSMWIESAQPFAGPDHVDVPIDPWVLGAWLGDGAARGGQLSIGVHDFDDMLAIIKERWDGDVSIRLESTAYAVSLSKRADECAFGHSDYRPRTGTRANRRCARETEHANMSPINVALRGLLGSSNLLHNKHIPTPYLRAGRQQRIDLLRGLMDTDGWWSSKRHRAGFTTTDDTLASNVVELLRTLGIHPQHFTKPYTNASRPNRTWHIVEFTPLGFNPFSLPRKAVLADTRVTARQADLAKRRIVASVQAVASVPTQCIEVDAPDSLYLCGDGFIPTHNSGKAPSERFEDKSLFQMKFYALVIWRTRGVIPTLLQLYYLADQTVLSYEPAESDLVATERKVVALWNAIEAAIEREQFPPRPSALCQWCRHQDKCPEFGGTTPPMPTITLVPGDRGQPEPAVPTD